jgi:uncharacterized protein
MSSSIERPDFRVLPALNAETKPFWTGGENGQLLVYRCHACTRYFHPPAPVCFRCRSTDVAPEPVSGNATLATYTINVHQWFAGFPPPYVVAIVEIDEEPSVRLTTNIVGCAVDEVTIGMKLRVDFEHWDDVWIPVFRPLVTTSIGSNSAGAKL